ncbi:hypothetical protein EYF80_028618 [Liparis tanakae]|uniref:Uncharacterized protein n=1 Tax=Liparis tanakae TaxID=230148 RepID=A0A4Z2H6G8_9TELE|nr:hypothetical protein EYF80_028618 [Liparis tanakae]
MTPHSGLWASCRIKPDGMRPLHLHLSSQRGEGLRDLMRLFRVLPGSESLGTPPLCKVIHGIDPQAGGKVCLHLNFCCFTSVGELKEVTDLLLLLLLVRLLEINKNPKFLQTFREPEWPRTSAQSDRAEESDGAEEAELVEAACQLGNARWKQSHMMEAVEMKSWDVWRVEQLEGGAGEVAGAAGGSGCCWRLEGGGWSRWSSWRLLLLLSLSSVLLLR